MQSPVATFNVVQGGNPQLTPESGYSFDTGVIFSPAGAPGLRASLDVCQIALNGYIDTPNDGSLLGLCTDGGRADVCGLIHRAPDGSVVSVSAVLSKALSGVRPAPRS